MHSSKLWPKTGNPSIVYKSESVTINSFDPIQQALLPTSQNSTKPWVQEEGMHLKSNSEFVDSECSVHVHVWHEKRVLGPGNRCPAYADMKTEKLGFADRVDIEINFAGVALASPACRKCAEMGVAESASTVEKASVNSAWLVDFVLNAVAVTAGASSAELIVELLTVADSAAVAAHVVAGENLPT
ncbi:hypothetical protein KFK09_006033 [Dendrobium nobile]|uniref:Uncharacterized protein n=1 Tax=Dendrobium nobile TaxID=94219 RepID=A0A8T3BS80_DENNO|nr:hypothetical protein KFK09_006033 [Dendrobium nobile]